jgi:hypothetical protein
MKPHEPKKRYKTRAKKEKQRAIKKPNKKRKKDNCQRRWNGYMIIGCIALCLSAGIYRVQES